MILITQFWNFENPERKQEVYDCLLRNARNRYINKIYVFSEDNSYIKFQHNKIVPLKANHRLSYFEMFKVVNQNFRNQVCIVSNADIYFDESIVKANHINYKNRIIALSSYDNQTKVIEDLSVDSWILKSITIPYSEYKIGTSHDDLRLIKSLSEYEIDIINPSKEIMSYHIDSRKSLKYIPEESMDYIEPSTLEEVPVKRNNEMKVEDIIMKAEDIKAETDIDIEIVTDKKDLRDNPKKKPTVVKDKEIPKPKKPTINSLQNSTKPKIAVHLHLYYQDLWDEFSSMFKNLDNYEYDIYITLSKDSATLGQTMWIKEKILKEYENATILEVDNKGLDIGAFMMVLEHINSRKINYEYLLKLHTKKSVKTAGIEFGNNWRRQLYKPLIGDSKIVDNILNKMIKNDYIGMVGNTTWISEFEGLNKDKISELKSILNIKTKNKRFIGGTMFWIKYTIIKRYFNTYAIRKIHSKLESGYFTDYELGTYTHSLERVLGYIVSDSNKIIDGV